ncbi:hypothetical protein RFI_35835 [Reticulomyxa filosa]|uniref:RanBP2-type domain-containing protein n=1 Tax=Reticulomyxa filosa TaxID=46433 RepID=X6LLJ8_RETFI|nr:hypothetical protein RFI_35835 [Reticulomyxa filosa]|eukprot:ETO01605.1 hypothetical protein RFI_35835 [Reticulomyxa filosa]
MAEHEERKQDFSYDLWTEVNFSKNQTDDGWTCTTCQEKNKKQYLQCIQCQTPKPNSNQPKILQFCFLFLFFFFWSFIYFIIFFFFTSSVPWKNTENFNCIIAIDFGTEGTAMAISMKNSTAVRSITDWSSSGVADARESTGKTKTTLLLNEERQVLAFGNEAWSNQKNDNYQLTHKKKKDINLQTIKMPANGYYFIDLK